MRALRYSLAALFAVFALLQVNDPDPVVWIVAYGLVALSIGAPPRSALAFRVTWLTGGVLLTLGLVALPGFADYLASGRPGSIFAEMSAEAPYIESARELLGIVIAGAALTGIRYRTLAGAAARPA